jgi:hypothetical protein
VNLSPVPATSTLNPRVPRLPALPDRLGVFVRRFDGHLAIVVIVGLLLFITALLATLMVMPAPILGGGDYGQWLMVARPFRGLEAPAYRNVAALPPLVSAVIAGLWTVVGNPLVALGLLNGLLLIGMVAGFAAAAYALFRNPMAAIVAPVVGLLVFDRFGELFAFGGILQLAADAGSLGALAALIAAETRPTHARTLRIAAVLLLNVVALSHVGTTEATVPIFLALAGVLGLRKARRSGFGMAARAYALPLLLLVPVAIYWAFDLLPANLGYFANPATAAYRDPGSFVTSLFTSFRPNAIVLSLGFLMLAIGVAVELRKRRLGPWLLLGIWAAVAWGELGVLTLVGTSTDYPRFATVLTPPLLLAVAGAIATLVQWFVRWLGARTWPYVIAAGVLAVALITPVAAHRQSDFAHYYSAPAGASLDAATNALDAALAGRPGAVVTTVRAGKWLEGITGRESLFAQPTRFAFRPDEWQRSLDSYVLANAAGSVASPSFLVSYQHAVASGGHASLSDLVIASNHDGEWVDLFATIVRDTFVIDSAGVKHSGPAFMPAADSSQGVADGTASIVTSWRDASGFTMNRTVSLSGADHTARLVETAAGAITTRLYPADGSEFTSLTTDANTATVCFKVQGKREPCVALSLADPTGTISEIGDGGLWVRGGSRNTLDLTVTNLTPGAPIVGLESLTPAAIAQSRNIVGAILEITPRGWPDVTTRLEALGMTLVGNFDRYAVYARPPG